MSSKLYSNYEILYKLPIGTDTSGNTARREYIKEGRCGDGVIRYVLPLPAIQARCMRQHGLFWIRWFGVRGGNF